MLGYIMVEEVVNGVRGFEDGEALVEDDEKLSLDFFERLFFAIEHFDKFVKFFAFEHLILL